VPHANTRRLRIEALRHEHAAQLFPSLADPRIYAYIPDDPPRSVAGLTHRYSLLERGAPAGSGEIWLNWAIRLRISPIYIGTLQATVYRRRTANIAYVLAPPYWGRGYATEACQWLLVYLAIQLRIVAFRATVDNRNEPSWRLLERLRFKRTGQQIVEFRGQPVTDYSYCLRPPRSQFQRGAP
jgi:RimJ/RimL family protein N-acetyltransferase